MERALSHSLASCSGLVARPARLQARPAAAAPRVARVALRPAAVAGLGRDSSATMNTSSGLNAPSAEEMASPVTAVSNRGAAAARRCRLLSAPPRASPRLQLACPPAGLPEGGRQGLPRAPECERPGPRRGGARPNRQMRPPEPSAH